jgi:cysteine-rich repeat protein
MLVAAVAARGGDGCGGIGDCDGDGMVQVNDLVRCVDDALRSGPPRCPSCDLNGDGQIAINEIIAVLNQALLDCATPTMTAATITPTPAPCGNGAVDAAGEECDDGNLEGGDGCAANCTAERRRAAQLDGSRSFATVQTEPFRVSLDRLVGTMVLTTGAARAAAVRGPDDQQRFRPGEIPVVVRDGDLAFEPISIPGSRCACVRGIEAAALGAGNVARGVIGCGAPLHDVDAVMTIDHNTTPGSAGNSGSGAGLADDPACDDCFDVEPGVRSCACQELGAACAARHAGVCNSPRVVTRSGGEGTPGSAVLLLHIAIGLLADGGDCVETRKRDGTCLYSDYGPDCLPCTDDDATFGLANLVVATTGRAEAAVLDANNAPGNAIAEQRNCSGEPCRTTISGTPFDCAQLAAAPRGGLGGGALATCFPGIDTDPLADTVTCARLGAQDGAAP